MSPQGIVNILLDWNSHGCYCGRSFVHCTSICVFVFICMRFVPEFKLSPRLYSTKLFKYSPILVVTKISTTVTFRCFVGFTVQKSVPGCRSLYLGFWNTIFATAVLSEYYCILGIFILSSIRYSSTNVSLPPHNCCCLCVCVYVNVCDSFLYSIFVPFPCQSFVFKSTV